MALLKVKFPHRDEDTGRWYAAGDYREVPDHLVEQFCLPYPGIGFSVLGKDHNTKIGAKAEDSLEEIHAAAQELRLEDQKLEAQEKAEAEAEAEEAKSEGDEPGEDAPKGRGKRNK
jgi:hypothetical protein